MRSSVAAPKKMAKKATMNTGLRSSRPALMRFSSGTMVGTGARKEQEACCTGV